MSRILLIALLLAPLSPLAQTSATSGDAAEAPADGKATGGKADTDAVGGTPTEPTDSPFDYEASEEISEDLSVSFPVDI